VVSVSFGAFSPQVVFSAHKSPEKQNAPRFGNDQFKTRAQEAMLYPGARQLDSAIPFISKPNEVTATLMAEAGEVPNIWGQSGEVHKYKPGQILMYYGQSEVNGEKKDDYAVCDPDVFAQTYTDESGTYFNRGTVENPQVSLKPGVPTRAIKRAEGKALSMPEGTTVHTLETLAGNQPPVTVQKGQIVVLDAKGNPYVQGIKNALLKKNIPVPGNQRSEALFDKLRKENP